MLFLKDFDCLLSFWYFCLCLSVLQFHCGLTSDALSPTLTQYTLQHIGKTVTVATSFLAYTLESLPSSFPDFLSTTSLTFSSISMSFGFQLRSEGCGSCQMMGVVTPFCLVYLGCSFWARIAGHLVLLCFVLRLYSNNQDYEY